DRVFHAPPRGCAAADVVVAALFGPVLHQLHRPHIRLAAHPRPARTGQHGTAGAGSDPAAGRVAAVRRVCCPGRPAGVLPALHDHGRHARAELPAGLRHLHAGTGVAHPAAGHRQPISWSERAVPERVKMTTAQPAADSSRRRQWARRLLLIYAVGVLLFVYVPPTYMLLISFNPGLLPHLPSLSHLSVKWYSILFSEERMIAALKASVVTGIATALITTVLAVLASLA